MAASERETVRTWCVRMSLRGGRKRGARIPCAKRWMPNSNSQRITRDRVRSLGRLSLHIVTTLSVATLRGACASLTSTTSIKPDMAFRLGGGQSSAFTVSGTNAGDVPVVV